MAGGSGGSVSGGDEHVFMRDAYRYGVGHNPRGGTTRVGVLQRSQRSDSVVIEVRFSRSAPPASAGLSRPFAHTL